jgi:ribose 5-phosphate isomerase A
MDAADRALERVADGDVVGLGTGRAATAFIQALGKRVSEGLRIRGVPTSDASARLAESLNIPLVGLDEVDVIDVAFDGADEVDPRGDLIKGYGGALVREKVVAASARRFVVLVGPEKLVDVLGSRGRLPVEVTPFALPLAARRLEALGYPGALRREGAAPIVTDNGNHILDCRSSAIPDPQGLEARILAIPGVLGTGLFVGMASTILIGDGDDVEVRELHRE